MSGTHKRRTGKSNDQVGEHAVQALYDDKVTSRLNSWIRPSGVHEPQQIVATIAAFLPEVLGCALLGLCVGVVKWSAVSDNIMLNAAMVAIAYSVSYYAGTLFNPNHVYRRHLNPIFTMCYFVTHQIGLLAVPMYFLAQFIGTCIAAGFISMLLTSTGPSTSIIELPVPLPVTTIGSATARATSFMVVWLSELLGGALLGFILLAVEFINTNPAKGKKNHLRATAAAAIVTGFLVFGLFQFQIYTFSPVVYGSGLFSGWGRSVIADGTTPDTRAAANMAQLKAVLYTGSVFGTDGNAWAYYIALPMASAALASLLLLATFWLQGDEARGHNGAGITDMKLGAALDQDYEPQLQAGKSAIYTGAAAIQKQVNQLRSPY
jgi:glycerol uptake facilitator-like aquaporin